MYVHLVLTSALEALYVHLVRLRTQYLVGLGVVLAILLLVLFVPAINFPKGTIVTVPENASFRDTAVMLAEQDIIGNAFLFRMLARVTSADRDVRSGKYLFEHPTGMAVVLWRLANGDSGIPAIRVTFPEGITAREMADILETSLPAFNREAFLEAAIPYEGYLFPDTYNFYADVTPTEIVARMRARFDEVIVPLISNEPTSEPLERLVIMASILEKETKVGADRNIVSGILWSRIDEGMALQVDAVFGYIKGIDTYHPSGEDLDIDSPYNTYRNRDLPPGAIGNPGEDAIVAAMTPTPSDYVYYLFGNDGEMHYAESFEEHKRNKELYLR